MNPRLDRRLLWGIALLLLGCAVLLRLVWPGAAAWAGSLVLLAGCVVAGAALYRPACHAAPLTVQQRYRREVLAGMAAYVLLLSGSLLLLRMVETPALRALVALAPVLPVALMLRAMVRFIRGVDELQQRIELEAVCMAAGLVSLGYVTAGFLQVARVIDVPAAAAMLWVFPLVCWTYGIAKAVVARRYR